MRSEIVAGGAAPRDEGATPGEVSAALTLIAPTGDAVSARFGVDAASAKPDLFALGQPIHVLYGRHPIYPDLAHQALSGVRQQRPISVPAPRHRPVRRTRLLHLQPRSRRPAALDAPTWRPNTKAGVAPLAFPSSRRGAVSPILYSPDAGGARTSNRRKACPRFRGMAISLSQAGGSPLSRRR